MMSRTLSLRHLLLATALATGLPLGAQAQQPPETTEPYRMLRSLQFVQDSVVLGDHSAAAMQRFMLETIDKRLRSADAAVFEDPRNVDAALVYSMSGGNPATLEYLVSRDVDGNFDTRLADALRRYLQGQGTLVQNTFAELVPEYSGSKVGAYVALVAANVAMSKNADDALKFYDWARLISPGTIVEEAALRRSISVALDSGKPDKAVDYSVRYARRFLHSPYASQFADLFVSLVVDHFDGVADEKVSDVLAVMDQDRQREIYLRIARAAVISGKNDLARMAAERARDLSKTGAEAMATLATLYGDLANVPTSDVGSALDTMAGIPDSALTAQDRALRDAARAVAEEVVRMPTSLPVDEPAPPEVEGAAADTGEQQDPTAPAAAPAAQASAPAATPTAPPAGDASPAPAETADNSDPVFRSFVDGGRSKLDAIDNLLKEESTSK